MSDRVRIGGRRRIDRVMDPGFLDGLSEATIAELRERRDLSRAEAEYLSILRRLLQGRRDILAAERSRRLEGEGAQPVVERLAAILSEHASGPARGGFPQVSLPEEEMSLARRHVERLVSDARLSDLNGLTDPDIDSAIGLLEEEERDVSAARAGVFRVHDTLQEELKRRYREDPSQVL